jgi:hypothetical protein
MWWHTRRNQISSFARNGRVHLNRRWASVQSTTGSRGVRISGSNAGYNMFRGSVKSTGYPLHSPFSPSPPPGASPCAITFQLDSTQNYRYNMLRDSVKSTGYPLHPPVSPSLRLPCVTVCHYISTGIYTEPRICLCCCVFGSSFL